MSNDATEEEIKKSYRRLSLQNHPDRNPSPEASEKIRLINTAYETLKDKETRRRYDQQLSMNGMEHGNQTMFFHTNFTENGEQIDFANINNIFQSIFGNKMNAQHFHEHFMNQLNKPPPVVCNIPITPVQSYKGGAISFEYSKWDIVNGVRQTKTEKITVTIPEGMENGEMIILREKGNSVNQLHGDVKICISVVDNEEEEKTTKFERNGLDLTHKKDLTLKEALCGFSFIIKHLNGSSYCVKNNTNSVVSPQQKQVIPNLGMKRDGNIGNLIIEYSVIFPKTLNKSQMDVLNEIL